MKRRRIYRFVRLHIKSVLYKIETYCWFGSAVFAKPCLLYLTSVGLTMTGATSGFFLASLSIVYHDHYLTKNTSSHGRKEIRCDLFKMSKRISTNLMLISKIFCSFCRCLSEGSFDTCDLFIFKTRSSQVCKYYVSNSVTYLRNVPKLHKH